MKYTETGGGRYPCVGIFLPVDDASSSVVMIGVVEHVAGNENDSVGNPCKNPKVDHGEEGAENHIWEVGDTGNRRGVKCS